MSDQPPVRFDVVIIGGGTAGITVAARLRDQPNPPSVAIVEPSDKHYYQPIWTLVGAGVFPKEVSERPEADYIPHGVTWIRDRVATLDPDARTITLASGEHVGWEQLVVAAGIQMNWSAIRGLEGNLGKNGVCSNYLYATVDSTWETLRTFKGGNAIFTFPNTPIKCAGAPQKIMYLADDWLRKTNVRSKSRVIYASSTPGIFGVQRYAASLRKVVERKGIETQFRSELVEVRAAERQAVFRHLDTGAETVLDYAMLHVVPPMSAPDFLRQGPLANAAGWVDVHKYTLQHTRYPDVWSLGDCSSLPTSRTGAAIRKQAPVLVENLMAHRAGRPLTASYDGYASCPLVTGYGRLIMAEFDYDGQPSETFPFDQSQERYSMYAFKAYVLPDLYWNGMLRGRI
ncbi:MAG TPA: FAD/NAD(P)-binding oxidoreductase [Myxococcota bacterium]|nr:FAD/NAD(P)-binding oxidoreductase [Myxococcota bacterium]